MAPVTTATWRKMRDDLAAATNTTYLGKFKTSAQLPEITWVASANGTVAAAASDASDFDKALEKHNADASKNPKPDPPNAMVFTAVGTFSRNTFYFGLGASFAGPMKFVKKATEIKLGAQIESQAIMSSHAKEGGARRGVLIDAPNEPRRIRVRHVLFEPRNANKDDDGSDGDGLSCYPLARWPDGGNTKCREALDAIIKAGSHDVRPLPAFDLSGELIKPVEYETKVRGATCAVHFTMSHYSIAEYESDANGNKIPNGKKTMVDVFTADVVNITVLRAAPPVPNSPRTGIKRFSVQNPLSPSKRARV